MGQFGVKKDSATRGVQIFQTMHESAMGGFTLDTTNLVVDTVIPAGTVMTFDESTRKASVVKSAALQASATNTDVNYKVLKGHLFKVGDYVAATKGSKAYAITAIDTTNIAYDTITVGTTLGAAFATGTALFQSGTTGASNASVIATPKGLLYHEYTVAVNLNLAIVLRGTVYARRIPAVADDVKASLPLIIFSQSF